MPERSMPWLKWQMKFVKARLGDLLEQSKAKLCARRGRLVGMRFLRPHLAYNTSDRAGFQPQRAGELVRAGVATYAKPYPAAGELLRDKWQRVKTAPARLWARVRDWHAGEVYVSPPDSRVLIMGIDRPWLATRFDAAWRKAPEVAQWVLIGVLATLLGNWMVG